jgi:hypothetical protein
VLPLRLLPVTAIVALGLLLAACPPEPDGGGTAATGGFELPPPLTETRPSSSPSAAPVVDPEDWRLPDPAGDPEHLPWLRLFYIQDNQAELEACGCPGQPSGGMARRATLAREIRGLLPDALLLEGPTALSRAVLGYELVRGDHVARARVILDAMVASRPAAFFPGQADFAVLGPAELARRAGELGLPLVVTNLDPTMSGTFLPYLVVPVKGRTVLLLGLVRGAGTEERRANAPVLDPVEAAAHAIALAEGELGRPVDLVIAFTDGDLRDLRRMRDDGLDVDILLARPEPSDRRRDWFEDGRLVVRADPLGRAYGRVDVAFSGPPGRGLAPDDRRAWQVEQVATREEQYLRQLRGYRGLEAALAGGTDPRVFQVGPDGVERLDPSTDPARVRAGLAETKAKRRQGLEHSPALRHDGHSWWASDVVIHPDVAEDPEVQEQLDRFAAGRMEKLRRERSQAPSARSAEYRGKDGCLDCHPAESADWARSPHASAWRSLVQRGEDDNPDCLPCHTVGFGQPGGFVDPARERALLGVQCEACHGPMALHADQAGQVGFKPDPGLPVHEVRCLTCHDEANSPRFDYPSWLPGMDHRAPGARR